MTLTAVSTKALPLSAVFMDNNLLLLYPIRQVRVLTPCRYETEKRLAEERDVSFSRYIELLVYADSLHNESAE
jgi:hypothetical protein